MFICLCNAVTDRQLIAAIKSGCDSLKKLQTSTGAMTQCCKCCDSCKELLDSTIIHDLTEKSSNLPS